MSAVMDYGRMNIPLGQWTQVTWADFKALLDRVDALDKKLGQPDCHDPAKAAWMRAVEARLAAMEKKVARTSPGKPRKTVIRKKARS